MLTDAYGHSLMLSDARRCLRTLTDALSDARRCLPTLTDALLMLSDACRCLRMLTVMLMLTMLADAYRHSQMLTKA